MNHEPRISTPETTKSRRAVALDQGTISVLAAHRRQQDQWKAEAGRSWPDHDLVFTFPDGRPRHPERFSREFDRRIQRWKLPRIRLQMQNPQADDLGKPGVGGPTRTITPRGSAC